MRLTLLLLALVLSACQTLPEQASDPLPPSSSAPPQEDPREVQRLHLVQEVDALLQQKYIDPLTRFIERHTSNSEPITRQYVTELHLERQKRCKRIAAVYAQRPKTAQVLARLKKGYHYSCPDIVQQFAAQVPVPDQPPLVQTTPAPVPPAVSGDDTPADSLSGVAVDVSEYAAEQVEIMREPPPQPVDPDLLAAQHTCHMHYSNKDYLAAAHVCEKPATNGDMASQYYIGVVFRALKSYEKALHWLKLAAAQDHGEADLELGQLYRLGQGVLSDMKTARMWYQRAAAQHQYQALYYLGLIADNKIDAYAWFNLAAQNGIAEAALKRDELDLQLNKTQRQAAQKLSLALHRELK